MKILQTIVFMGTNTKKDSLALISRENLISYNFSDGEPIKYEPVRMWHLFDQIHSAQSRGMTALRPEDILSTHDRITYMKAYTVAVVDAIYRRFGKLPDHGRGEIQREYLASSVEELKRSYENNLNETVFAFFPTAPATSGEEDLFRGLLVRKADWIIAYKKRDTYKRALTRDGIDYKRYLDAWVAAKTAGTTDQLNLDDFRDPTKVREITQDFEEVEQYCAFDSFLPDTEPETAEYLEPVPGVVLEPSSTLIEDIAKRFGLFSATDMKTLYSHFDNDRVKEVPANELWTVKVYELKMALVWKLFSALKQGAVLSKDGRVFLLTQFLFVALVVFKAYRNYPADALKREAFLNPDRMMFLTKVISDGYVYFLRHYDSKILQMSEPSNPKRIYIQIRKYFSMRINKLISLPATTNALPFLLQPATSDEPDLVYTTGQPIDIEEYFSNEEAFATFISQIEDNLEGAPGIAASTDTNGPKGSKAKHGLEPWEPEEHSSKAIETINFQEISGILGFFGFETQRLFNDSQGADFLANHMGNGTVVRVQLKGRLTFSQDYIGKDLSMVFHDGSSWYFYPHDAFLTEVDDLVGFSKSKAWVEQKKYHWPKPPKEVQLLLDRYRIAPRIGPLLG